jgi:hypothetical protein
MTTTIAYHPLPISTEDLLRLKAAVGDRDRTLLLILLHTDEGEESVAVAIKGVEAPLYTVRRATPETSKPVWLVCAPKDGPLHEFKAPSEVAAFLTSGDARLCQRSWMTGRSEPGLIVGGELPAAKRKWAPGVGR